jgi:hypothetical protein
MSRRNDQCPTKSSVGNSERNSTFEDEVRNDADWNRQASIGSLRADGTTLVIRFTQGPAELAVPEDDRQRSEQQD